MKARVHELFLGLFTMIILASCGQALEAEGSPTSPAGQRTAADDETPTPATAIPTRQPTVRPINSPQSDPQQTAQATALGYVQCAPVPLMQITEYEGVSLPGPEPIQNPDMDVRLPPAWLLTGGEAVAGNPGSHTCQIMVACPYAPSQQCGRMTHLDAVAPGINQDVAPLNVPAGDEPVIVVAAGYIAGFTATLQDWTGGAMYPLGDNVQLLSPSTRADGDVTTYTLPAIDSESEQLLSVHLEFTGSSNEIMYYWRLIPSD